MKSVLSPLFVLFLFLTACAPQPEAFVESSWTDTQPKVVAYYVENDEGRVKVKEEKFYNDGQLEYSGGIGENGERHGEWTYYYTNGQLWSLGVYDNGKMEGKKEVYWPDGTMRYKGQFSNDQKTGTWTFYNVDGSILEERTFDAESSK